MLIDSKGKLKKRKFDPKINREILSEYLSKKKIYILSELIIAHDFPFSIVEWRVLRKYQNIFNEYCRNISKIMAK